MVKVRVLIGILTISARPLVITENFSKTSSDIVREIAFVRKWHTLKEMEYDSREFESSHIQRALNRKAPTQNVFEAHNTSLILLLNWIGSVLPTSLALMPLLTDQVA